MSRSFVAIVLLLVLGAGGGYWFIHKDDNRLRMDACSLRGRMGEITDGMTISPMDKVQLDVTMRGCTADGSQMCLANVVANIAGPSKDVVFRGFGPDGVEPLNDNKPFKFRKNSAITSMEVHAEASGFPPGDYTVTVVGSDLNAHKTVEKQFKFSSKM